MEVNEDGSTDFKVYLAAEENDRDPKNDAARRVSISPDSAIIDCLIISSFRYRGCHHISFDRQLSLYRAQRLRVVFL